MRMRNLLSLLLTLLIASATFAQSAKVKGRVMDGSGSVMPGVQVKLYQADKVVSEGVTSGTGEFEINANPGDYKLEIAAPDFNTYAEMVKVTPEMTPLAVTMELAVIAQNVEVTETRNEISIDSDSSLSTTVLGRDFIDALPDDEDDLAAYLQQIAGTRGGAGGGASFIIDGFTGGRIPPKDQIQEIRISNSPFSAEFSGIGYGRTEIITRAGTGDFRGQMNFQFRDESLNARNPFVVHQDGTEAKRTPSQSRNFNTNFSGPIIRNKLSLNLQARHNDNENSNVIRAQTLDSQGNFVTLSDPYVSPNRNRGANARTQLAINKNNTLYTNFNYQKQENRNQGLNEFTLLSRASDRFSHSSDFQIRETSILNSKMVHETRFQFSRDTNQQTPRTIGVAIDVPQFSSGGGQNKSSSNNKESEFGNLLMYSGSKWTFKAGSQGVVRRNHSLSENNFIGTWRFSSLADYKCASGLGCDPGASGIPLQFTRTSGDPRLDSSQFEIATFVQTDYKVSKTFNLSFGARYEDQTNISDHNNIDPRMGFAYQIGKSTAVRGGVGTFHQRFGQNNYEQLLRFDGTRQLQIIARFPQTYPNIPADAALPPSSLRTRSSNLVNPYNVNASLSLEQAIWRGLGVTFSWDGERGIHLYRSRNINAPLPDAPLDFNGNKLGPDGTTRLTYLLESTGQSKSNNFTVGMRDQLRGKIQAQIFGSYTLGYTKNNTDGAFSLPVNSYDTSTEWGRSPQDTRHRFNTGMQIRLPWGVSTTTQVNWSSSRPYNITTGGDCNADNSINDRPTDAALALYKNDLSAWYASGADPRTFSTFIKPASAYCAIPGTIIARNSGKGPGQFNVQMNFQKTIRLKSPESAPANRAGNGAALNGVNNYVEPQRGGGGFPGGGGGGDFGGGQRGGGDRGGDFAGGQRGNRGNFPNGGNRGQNQNFNQNNGKTVTFNVQIQNLLNNTQLNGYSGTMSSTFFGRASTARNPRQVEAGLRFNF
jgi:hypothetical protein